MRQLAAAFATTLVFTLVVPAFAQPFADVPTNHWAYDAIAELAAKGLVEGFPDGTFRGDRAMTRFEMAMIVARLLARIESIKIPAPTPAAPAAPAPTVTPQNLVQIQRLVNEFRAELAALGVRVTAIEEELNAIKARQDNVRISGGVRFRYEVRRGLTPGLGGPLAGNGNPNTQNTDASQQALLPRIREAARVLFDGSVTPDVHLLASIMTLNFATFNSSNVGNAAQFTLATVDNLFFDWKNAFGWPVELWLGRFGGGGLGGATAIGTTFPVQFGPFGLLMNTLTDQWTDTTLNSGANVVDGLYVRGHWASLADLQIQGLITRIVGGVGSTSYFSGEDAYGVDANVRVREYLRVGGYYVGNQFTSPGSIPTAAGAPSALYHVYGPAGGSLNPVTSHCPAASGGVTGIACPAAGNGWVGYVNWNAFPAVTLDAEYATWNDGVFGTSDNGYQVNVGVDLGTLTGWGRNLTLNVGYLNFGPNFYPPYGMVSADSAMLDSLYPGNAQGVTVQASLDVFTGWNLYGIYFSGNSIAPNLGETEWETGIKYKFAPGASFVFKVRDLKISGVEQLLLYRAQMDYRF